ncbi:PREDICTED: tetratricopeptide repeat protein 25-like [Polistes dominula]|uniref:Outer dynein arm-docking complex subunit 4 n=1 Tax=Polistes dominula TaxID=743375 RepID=A0ABM1J7A8_POLDO|nr:PREDICTED: tetratricopeptide repeat protein 25-like [Polistes dominula]
MTSTLISTSSKTRSVTILTDDDIKDEFGNIEETKKAVERAINRARKNTQSTNNNNNNNNNNTTSNLIGKDRRFAQALHQEADQLYQKGDYETALVLYHRAANICPRDINHNAAVRRTATMINTWQNSSKRLRKFMSKTNPDSELTIALCPEAAAIKASNVLKQSPDFNTVNKVLNYFDEHENLWKGSSSINTSITKLRLTRSNVILNRMKMMAETNLKKLEIAFHSGNVTTTVKYAKELLTMSNGIEETKRYETEAYRYLALTHVMLGRHDIAVNYVAKMIYIAKMSEDSILMSQALVTLGKVHLSFDHLDAAAKAWEHLSKNLKELSPILRAWINHEIGRCHLETGQFMKAFDMGTRTMEIAEDILSNKWILHGKLLRAQALVKLGRFSEALEEFRICARISEEEGDTPMLSYIQNLIVDLTSLLRKITFSSKTQIGLNKYVDDQFQDDSIITNDTVISSLCSSSQNLEEEEEEEEEEMNEQMNGNSTSRTFRKEFENSTSAEVRLTNSSNSTTSLKSQVTNATYVIDKTTCMQHQAEMETITTTATTSDLHPQHSPQLVVTKSFSNHSA